MNEKLYKAFNSDIENASFTEADELKKKLASFEPYSEQEQACLNSYMDDFIVRFVHSTNAIEGSSLSLEDIKMIINGDAVPEGARALNEIFAAKGNADGAAFVEYALDGSFELTEGFIKDVHEKTMLDCQASVRGIYRRTPVYIKDALTVPAEPSKIRDLMPTLIFICEQSSAHPIAKAAAFHVMFERIHPFQDGNGPTGRLVLNFMLQKAGYPPIAIKSDDGGKEYMASLEEWAAHGEPADFLKIVESCVVAELQGYIKAVEDARG